MIRRYSSSTQQRVDSGLRQYMLNIYSYMGLGLALTGVIAFLISTASVQIKSVFSGLAIFSMFGTLGIVLYFNFAFQRITFSTAQALFWAFSALMGISLFGIFDAYTMASIGRTFFITAATFGSATLYGYVTQRDLSSMGSFLFMGLIGIIIASVVNMFLGSSALGFAISIIGVLVFTGLTIYDTQKLRYIYYQLPSDGVLKNKVAILGALSLYLDVINIFLLLLRLIGDRK